MWPPNLFVLLLAKSYIHFQVQICLCLGFAIPEVCF